MGKTLCAVLALLFVACMCIDEAGEKDVIKRGKEIFRSLKGNPKGTIKKEQMRAMLTALFDEAWTTISGNVSTEDPAGLKNGARAMISSYADSLPETMTTEQFFNIIKEGTFMQKLLEIAQGMDKKKSEL